MIRYVRMNHHFRRLGSMKTCLKWMVASFRAVACYQTWTMGEMKTADGGGWRLEVAGGLSWLAHNLFEILYASQAYELASLLGGRNVSIFF